MGGLMNDHSEIIELAQTLETHVNSRGGMTINNGAWDNMLKASYYLKQLVNLVQQQQLFINEYANGERIDHEAVIFSQLVEEDAKKADVIIELRSIINEFIENSQNADEQTADLISRAKSVVSDIK